MRERLAAILKTAFIIAVCLTLIVALLSLASLLLERVTPVELLAVLGSLSFSVWVIAVHVRILKLEKAIVRTERYCQRVTEQFDEACVHIAELETRIDNLDGHLK